MNKKEAKAKIREILEAIYPIKDLLEELKGEAQETSENIEPYEGRYDLTEAQQERQTWFEELAYTLEELFDNIESAQGELEEKVEGC